MLYKIPLWPSVSSTYRPLGYEKVYLPLCKVADTPFLNQGDDIHITASAPPHYRRLCVKIVFQMNYENLELYQIKLRVFYTFETVDIVRTPSNLILVISKSSVGQAFFVYKLDI